MSAAIVKAKSLPIIFTDEAQSMKASALALAGPVQEVTSPEQNQQAVTAQLELSRILKLVKNGVQPLIDKANNYKKAVWAAQEQFVSQLEAEELRLSRLAGDYAALEQARLRSELQAQNDRLSQLERERASALAQAQNHDQFDAIAEDFNNRVAAMAPVQEPAKAKGQVLTDDWTILISDIHMLYRCHPRAVKLEPLMSEIKALLKLGITPKGVTATPIVKATVRAKAEPKAIEI